MFWAEYLFFVLHRTAWRGKWIHTYSQAMNWLVKMGMNKTRKVMHFTLKIWLLIDLTGQTLHYGPVIGKPRNIHLKLEPQFTEWLLSAAFVNTNFFFPSKWLDPDRCWACGVSRLIDVTGSISRGVYCCERSRASFFKCSQQTQQLAVFVPL